MSIKFIKKLIQIITFLLIHLTPIDIVLFKAIMAKHLQYYEMQFFIKLLILGFQTPLFFKGLVLTVNYHYCFILNSKHLKFQFYKRNLFYL